MPCRLYTHGFLIASIVSVVLDVPMNQECQHDTGWRQSGDMDIGPSEGDDISTYCNGCYSGRSHGRIGQQVRRALLQTNVDLPIITLRPTLRFAMSQLMWASLQRGCFTNS